ncbi:polysaccharide deacetylase family protein [Myceligenerans indicum]|uniref:Polysaccharide deacetylase family protein n=1 Tax=Myceligenerans indicum TaxID=2593663 RepID=A0ABS1LKI9_9MICO|nr:polysaccharide deacetylase family protein [Myceligenerans indicum]MBL0886736.1 polysaccharide deacetylase family protein [Myceligenerans indicum]
MSSSAGSAETPTPRRRPRWWWITAAVVLAIGAPAGVAGILEHRAWAKTVAAYDAEVARVTDEAERSRASAEDGYASGLDALNDAIDAGRRAYGDSKGQVADDEVRKPLASALDDAGHVRDTEVGYPVTTRTVDRVTRSNPFRRETLPEVDIEFVKGAVPAPADLDAAAADVTEARDAVTQARRKWAFGRLRSATTEGADALDSLRPQVGKESLKTLDDAVTEAEAALAAGTDALDPDRAVTLRHTLLDSTESLWAGRLARILTERRAAARADGIDCRTAKCVALTFDDGPVTDTRRLLRVLDREHAPATFFMAGDNVARQPDIARAVVDGGHLVANHSWDHPQLTKLDDVGVRDELLRTQAAITEATGFMPFLLRPPYGAVDDRVRTLATRVGLDVVLWTVDTDDWRTRDAARTRMRVRTEVRPGSIVLMHDIHPSSIDAVPGIVDDLRAAGYVLVTADLLVQ